MERADSAFGQLKIIEEVARIFWENIYVVLHMGLELC